MFVKKTECLLHVECGRQELLTGSVGGGPGRRERAGGTGWPIRRLPGLCVIIWSPGSLSSAYAITATPPPPPPPPPPTASGRLPSVAARLLETASSNCSA